MGTLYHEIDICYLAHLITYEICLLKNTPMLTAKNYEAYHFERH